MSKPQRPRIGPHAGFQEYWLESPPEHTRGVRREAPQVAELAFLAGPYGALTWPSGGSRSTRT